MTDPETGAPLDAVVDINKLLFDIHWTPWWPAVGKIKPTSPKQYMQDCQLIASRSRPVESERADLLVLLCNEFATPVRLQRRRRGDPPPPPYEEHRERDIPIHNAYGTGLRLTARRKPNLIVTGAKNMHVFASRGATFLEFWPGGPHEAAPLDFARYPYVTRDHVGGNSLRRIVSRRAEPASSFAAEHNVHNNRLGTSILSDRDSGSACCVPIEYEGRSLLLGFAHRKTRPLPPDAFNYVSRVYAFEPVPPFHMVARSGFFCLGFAAPPDDAGGGGGTALLPRDANEQVGGAAHQQKLQIHRKNFACPKIHFVSGVAEKLGDNRTVLVSYGINDCYPRVVEVPKAFLATLLRGNRA